MASYSVPCPKTSAFASSVLRAENFQQQQQQSKVSFAGIGSRRHSLIGGSSSDLSLSARFQGSKRNQSTVWKAQVNEVAVEKSSNSTLVSPTNFEVIPSDGKDIEPTKEPGFPDSSISAFMSEVASLVKLVDSRDITELQLKQRDYELIIRKKEALPQPVSTGPVYMMQPPSAPTMLPSQPPPVQAAAPALSAPALPAPGKSSKSSHPPLKCPMAGTFYRCPAPGEPPFVKVGDKVQKGQVLCIIEAMKLMNEIEADQSGTVVEVVAEDGKPVSVDTPLFIIEP
ncbi:biotin carboxyl carrier protein of acetyl-CoA carboxylase 2, chloroplastic-like protein [Cinnamomum micranthum f. kanehirae]|uniref:Biotin carboxyl carrier protein of acetyl-CoA carboxylase n=1 Tax=Cinnamomum micranthum f. kanehirae TaxID=337451 RepID=A0A3S3M519_9MAGN|nr:biotin carboxyl carrier protein of acetyl-CoA carboxylase 2, chloroplastic-like protein [Cinnamomum micranthum f. kanehirae]